jgi:membrane protease YdiL (CAAX protease family)
VEKLKFTLVTVLLICVQPAIVEELFFRQMTLGVFRKSMNLHLAVWATAGLFAFAHLTNPFGMPYLFLAGAMFGYARVYGGLPLAMVLHFLHNLAVVSYEALK